MAEMQKLKIEVVRYNPEVDTAPHSAFYEVPYDEQTSLLDALGYIKDNLAPDLSYRQSTYAGSGDEHPDASSDGEIPSVLRLHQLWSVLRRVSTVWSESRVYWPGGHYPGTPL